MKNMSSSQTRSWGRVCPVRRCVEAVRPVLVGWGGDWATHAVRKGKEDWAALENLENEKWAGQG
jgi:hypothetical protein